MKARVTVISLAYNVGPYIAQAIAGVVGQKADFGIRLIIAEDNSTDGTLAAARQWQARYPGIITVLHNGHNLGLQANFMSAYSHCDTEYVAICDGDDYWFDRHKLQTMVDYMDAHSECAVAFHRVINYYEYDRSKSLSNGGQRSITTVEDLARSNYIKSCDYAMHILNACHGNIRYFSRPMGIYRQHGSGIWSLRDKTDREKKLGMALDVRERLIDHLPPGQDAVREIIRDAHTRFALAEVAFSLAHGLDDAAARLTRRVMAYRPGWTTPRHGLPPRLDTGRLRSRTRTRHGITAPHRPHTPHGHAQGSTRRRVTMHPAAETVTID